MEEKVLPDPAVAGALRESYVESRLHVDTQGGMSEAQFADNQARNTALTDELVIPHFVVVDPATGDKVAEHGLAGQPDAWGPALVKFLDATAAGR